MEHLLQYDIDPQSSPESQPDPTLVKQQKAYEKKLKQYEKDKVRREYFQANKERILKNKQAVMKHNEFEKRRYASWSEESDVAYNPNKIDKAFGFIDVWNIMTFMHNQRTQNHYQRYDDEMIAKYMAQETEALWWIRNIQFSTRDKALWFLPIYTWSFVCSVYGDSWIWLISHPIFSFPPLPKKPIPPEAPKEKAGAEKELTELKKEVLTSKEMNRSKKTSGDMISTTYEVVSNGKTIRLDKETYDLYLQFKATRKERPHDLDLSFDHFKATYLDKHPQFMRKVKK